jgi:hypothetical protein
MREKSLLLLYHMAVFRHNEFWPLDYTENVRKGCMVEKWKAYQVRQAALAGGLRLDLMLYRPLGISPSQG